VKKSGPLFRYLPSVFFATIVILTSQPIRMAVAQAVPYARTFYKSTEEVGRTLKEVQAYAGQKLPIVDGFVGPVDQPLDRYERAFYQFSIELAPGASGGTVVSVTAKITAWYADRDPSKSGYQVLPSNGRLELDLLDRLSERLGGKPLASVPRSTLQAPVPKLDVSAGSLGRPLVSGNSAPAPTDAIPVAGGDEVAALRMRREAEEKRLQQLNAELQSLQDIQHNQAHPGNLVTVKQSGTPVLVKAAPGARVLFTAALDDEFEFLDAEGEWIHVQISGASRGYIRRSNLELPEAIAARLRSPNDASSDAKDAKRDAFRVTREEISIFPGEWEPLHGKSVKIYMVQPQSEDAKETGAAAKLNFAASLFQKFSRTSAQTTASVEGVVIIFDSADGGILASTASSVQQFASGALSRDSFWKVCYLDPSAAFQPNRTR
jgi:hypothetical protein